MPFVFSINLPVDIELSWFWGYISCGKFQFIINIPIAATKLIYV